MPANDLVEALVTKLNTSDTWGALSDYRTLQADPAGLDDAHKIMLADALLRPEWKNTPPRPPAPAPNP
jgi:hypothetical protein